MYVIYVDCIRMSLMSRTFAVSYGPVLNGLPSHDRYRFHHEDSATLQRSERVCDLADLGTSTSMCPLNLRVCCSRPMLLWQDTAGQERFSGLSSAFFRGADAVLLMFDVNRPDSLRGLQKWWDEFKARAPVADEDAEDFCCVVVGNKIDLAEAAQGNSEGGVAGSSRVSESEAESFLERLIPRTVDASDEDSFYEEEPFPPSEPVAEDVDRRTSLFSLRPSWSGFSLRPVVQETSTPETPTVTAPSPQTRTQSIDIQSLEGELPSKRLSSKSRSS